MLVGRIDLVVAGPVEAVVEGCRFFERCEELALLRGGGGPRSLPDPVLTAPVPPLLL